MIRVDLRKINSLDKARLKMYKNIPFYYEEILKEVYGKRDKQSKTKAKKEKRKKEVEKSPKRK